jgi:hypothetical protein
MAFFMRFLQSLLLKSLFYIDLSLMGSLLVRLHFSLIVLEAISLLFVFLVAVSGKLKIVKSLLKVKSVIDLNADY